MGFGWIWCVPRVDKIKTIPRIKKLTYHFFSRIGFILCSLEESPRSIYRLVPLCKRVRVIYLQPPDKVNLSLSWGAGMLLRYLWVLRAAEKCFLRARLAVKWERERERERKREREREKSEKRRESMALDWKFGTQKSGDQNPLRDKKNVNLYSLFLLRIITQHFKKFYSIFIIYYYFTFLWILFCFFLFYFLFYFFISVVGEVFSRIFMNRLINIVITNILLVSITMWVSCEPKHGVYNLCKHSLNKDV